MLFLAHWLVIEAVEGWHHAGQGKKSRQEVLSSDVDAVRFYAFTDVD